MPSDLATFKIPTPFATCATVAIRFGPPENFALMVLGIACTLFMITGSPVKGVLDGQKLNASGKIDRPENEALTAVRHRLTPHLASCAERLARRAGR